MRTKAGQVNTSIRVQKRMIIAFALVAIVFVALAVRIGWIQIVATEKYALLAAERQTKDVIIPAKRGAVFDRNYKELAISAISYKVWVRPADVPSGKTDDVKKARLDNSVTMLAETLEMDGEEVRNLVTQDKTRVRIAKNVEKETADAIKARIKEENLTGIELEEDVSRYYPLGDFAPYVLGSTSDDNYGLSGVEQQYNQFLSGVSGRWIKNTDGAGDSLAYGMEKHYEAQNGLNLVLTIDEVIQHYVEKALENVQVSTDAKRVYCLVMDPKTGDVLAMAMTPGYDPNDPRTPLSEEEAAYVETLSDEDKVTYWNNMWRNPMISEVYDPGSTFKLLTVAAALEERVTSPSDTFYCNGYYDIGTTKLRCWRHYEPHGAQTLREGVGNSCNPVMITLAQRMGFDKFYQYIELFGMTEKTGIDYPGETGSLVQSKEVAGPVGLATMSFGQGISVTPIQLLTAVSALGNDGKLMQPRLVKAMVDKNGEVVEEYDTKVVRQVVSEQTAAEMRDIMEYVVEESGGKAAKVPGYRIGGKTGTAEKLDNGSYKTGKVMASMVAMAPIDDPKVSVLLIVDEPQGVKFGSTTAGPGVQEIMSEVLRYLNIEPSYTQSELSAINASQITVPNVTGMNYSDAAGVIIGSGLTYTASPAQSEETDFHVVDQYPKAGEKLDPNGLVCLYKE